MILKKTGSIFVLTAFLCHQAYAATAQITLTLSDDHNRPCREAEIGSTYRLEARVQGVSIKGWPQIAGLPADAVTGRQQRQEVSWLQGKKTESTCFVWEVMFNAPGTITLGPVSYTNDAGTTTHSTSLSICIREPSTPQLTTTGKTTSASSAFIRWELDRLDPFVGETIPVRLVFYTTDTTTQLENISEISLKDAHLELTQEPTWASAHHNGISYKTATWEGVLVPASSGICSLPAVTISYRIDSPHSNSYSPWAMMHRMLNSFSRLYHKRTATLSLQVRALPPTSHTIIGVGEIHCAHRTCNNASMRCGEAGTMVYHLEGSIHPQYVQLPTDFASDRSAKIYKSTYTHQGTSPAYRYDQEYVIHPQEAGHISYEEQTLWYFNPHKELYESCTVPLFEIDVQASEKVTDVHNNGSDKDIEQSDTKEAAPQDTPQSVMPRFPIRPMLPLPWFLLFLLLPCFMTISKNWLRRHAKKLYYSLKLRWVRRTALRKLAAATHNKDGYMMLHVLRHVVRYAHAIPHDTSEGCFVEQYLTTRGTDPKEIEDWKKLWTDIQKAAFSASLHAEEYASLQTRCHKWINVL